MSVISEIKEDIECLKYCIKHFGVGGSTERLARMVRMELIFTLILIILILIFAGR